MKILGEQPRKVKDLEIIGEGPGGTVEQIADYYHRNLCPECPLGVLEEIIELVKTHTERVEHRKGIAHLDLTSLITQFRENITKRAKETIPEKLIGFYGEKVTRDFLEGLDEVELVEQASLEEDWQQKIDFFIKFKGVEEPLAVQFTFGPYEAKKGLCTVVTKKKNPESKINPKESLNCPLVLVKGNYQRFSQAWRSWFLEAEGKPERKAADYLPNVEKAHLLLQLLRTPNKEQRRIIEKIAVPFLRDAVEIAIGRSISVKRKVELSSLPPEFLEKMIEEVRRLKL